MTGEGFTLLSVKTLQSYHTFPTLQPCFCGMNYIFAPTDVLHYKHQTLMLPCHGLYSVSKRLMTKS